jgi:2-polyprenyl-3-methyl-5-hydroxy-6-metoxy-1,4-benzoquinol methylase
MTRQETLSTPPPPSPELFFATITAYQRTAALVGALELDVCTAIAEGHTSSAALAEHTRTSPRGVRILCDYLTTLGLLTKDGDRYALTGDSAAFLDRRSPSYLGGAATFIASPHLMAGFSDVAGAVRRGGTTMAAGGTMAPEHPVWVDFARTMVPITSLPAREAAARVPVDRKRTVRILDVAAGHGAFGIAFAERHANVEVTALDWPGVVAVASEHARARGVGARYRTIAGSAFDADWGTGYDIVLFANFLHHVGPADCERLIARARAALLDDGRVVTVEFVPNEDRVTPAATAGFALVMLCTTEAGDAYTFAEYERMFRSAGFARNEMSALPPSTQHVVVSYAAASQRAKA